MNMNYVKNKHLTNRLRELLGVFLAKFKVQIPRLLKKM